MPTKTITMPTKEGDIEVEVETFGKIFCVHPGMPSKEKREEIEEKNKEKEEQGKRITKEKPVYVVTHIPTGMRIVTSPYKSHMNFIAKKLREAFELGVITIDANSTDAEVVAMAFPKEVITFLESYKRRALVAKKSSEIDIKDVYTQFLGQLIFDAENRQVEMEFKKGEE